MKKLNWTTVQRKVNDLVPLEINPRKISEAKRMKMIESLQKFGLVDIPTIDFDNTVVSGHQRLRALQAIGQGEDLIDVRYPNRKLTERELKELNLLGNTHFGEWDEDIFAEFFSDVDISGLGFEPEDFRLPDLSAIAPPDEPQKLEAKEDDYEISDTIVTDIVPGDLFEIGLHRLLCGDSTSADDVGLLMGGESADMVFTDPPYGLGGYGGRKKMDLQGDDGDVTAFYLLLVDAPEKYIWGNFKNLMHHIRDEPRDVIVWRKNNFGLGRGYRGQYELCFYYGSFDGSDSDVWDVAREPVYSHPTQKPVELPGRAMRNSTLNGALVVDLFLGSGTTMVAAHQLNRRCYGMEIDPQYCQVIVDRMLRLDPSLTITRNGQPYEPKR